MSDAEQDAKEAASDAVQIARINAAVEKDRLERQHTHALEIKRLEGDQQRALAELTNANSRALAAENRAAEYERARIAAESALKVERAKTKGQIGVEGRKGTFGVVVAALALISGIGGAMAARGCHGEQASSDSAACASAVTTATTPAVANRGDVTTFIVPHCDRADGGASDKVTVDRKWGKGRISRAAVPQGGVMRPLMAKLPKEIAFPVGSALILIPVQQVPSDWSVPEGTRVSHDEPAYLVFGGRFDFDQFRSLYDSLSKWLFFEDDSVIVINGAEPREGDWLAGYAISFSALMKAAENAPGRWPFWPTKGAGVDLEPKVLADPVHDHNGKTLTSSPTGKFEDSASSSTLPVPTVIPQASITVSPPPTPRVDKGKRCKSNKDCYYVCASGFCAGPHDPPD